MINKNDVENSYQQYFNAEHNLLRKALREFVKKEIIAGFIIK